MKVTNFWFRKIKSEACFPPPNWKTSTYPLTSESETHSRLIYEWIRKKGTLRRKKHKNSWCWRTEQHFSKYGLPASGNICIILGAAPGHDVSGYLPQLEPTSIRWYANQYLKCQIRRLVLWNRFIAGTTTFFSCSTEFLFQSLTAWS